MSSGGAPDAMLMLHAGFGVALVQEAVATRYVVRVAKNATCRRGTPPPYRGRGRPPARGDLVRPSPRTYNGAPIPATPPDRIETWPEGDRLLRAERWDDLVLPDAEADVPRFTAIAIHDPRYRTPLLLATPLPLPPRTLRDCSHDRWPVEQLPLAANQLLGAARQFVHAPETCQRLPPLALLAGAVLSYAAATAPAIPTGFWDRHPKPTPGRLRRGLARCPFPHDFPLSARIREKVPPPAHLPKGFWGQRRPPTPLPPAPAAPSMLDVAA